MLMNERAMNAGWQDVPGRVRIAWRQLNNICILKMRQSDKERKKAANIRNDDEARKKNDCTKSQPRPPGNYDYYL